MKQYAYNLAFILTLVGSTVGSTIGLCAEGGDTGITYQTGDHLNITLRLNGTDYRAAGVVFVGPEGQNDKAVMTLQNNYLCVLNNGCILFQYAGVAGHETVTIDGEELQGRHSPLSIVGSDDVVPFVSHRIQSAIQQGLAAREASALESFNPAGTIGISGEETNPFRDFLITMGVPRAHLATLSVSQVQALAQSMGYTPHDS